MRVAEGRRSRSIVPMDRFVELEAFVAVVETGSMSAAAARLGVAVSAVSRRLGDLEGRLGVRLANRSTRGLVPTPSGLAYHERATALLAALAAADASVTGREAALRGTLRVALPLSYGTRVIAPVLHRFALERPELLIDVDYADRRIDLVEEGVDLAVRIGELEDSSLVARRLGRIEHAVAASPAFWDRWGRPASPTDLEPLDALCYGGRERHRRWPWTASDGERGEARVRARLTATNGDALVAAAEAGLGVIREPDFIAGDAIARGTLEPVLGHLAWSPMAVQAVFPQGRALAPPARDFLERLVEALGPGA